MPDNSEIDSKLLSAKKYKEVVQRIEKLEAMSRLFLEEVTELKKSLSPVEGRASKAKYLTPELKAKISARLFKTR